MSRFLVVCVLFAATAVAEEGRVPGCADEAVYGALDFWVGDWDVFVGDELVGTNRVEKILSGCAVLEHWRSADGGEGKSLFFVSGDGIWKQVWVTQWASRPGGVKEKVRQPLDDPGRVRLQGRITLADGNSYLDRTTLTLMPTGEVRQVIETSTDEGDTWTVGFDAVYRSRE